MIANLAEFTAPPETPRYRNFSSTPRQVGVESKPIEKVILPAPQIFSSVVVPSGPRRMNGWKLAAVMCRQ